MALQSLASLHSRRYSSGFAYTLLIIFFTLKQCINILLITKIYSKQRLSGFAISYSQHFFVNGYLFYLFYVVKSDAVQYRLNVKWCPLLWTTLSN